MLSKSSLYISVLLSFASGLLGGGWQAEFQAGAAASGTLNLVLANQNGFVIAADSRMSSTAPFDCNGIQQFYCDNSQKLFRTGRESAIVIAGFAVGQGGTPLDLAVASVLRKHFGPAGNQALQVTTGKGGGVSVVDAPPSFEGVGFDSMWLRNGIGPALVAVASLLYAPPTAPPNLLVTLAGIDKDKGVILKRMEFLGSWTVPTEGLAPIPMYQVRESSIDQVRSFVWSDSGITCVADAILNGFYSTTDPIINAYYRKRRDQPLALDSMSLEDMANLARVILRETGRFTNYVGGPDQVGVFPTTDEPHLFLPPLPDKTKLLPRFFYNQCLGYAKGSRQNMGACANGTFFEDFSHGLDEVIAQFFLGCKFTGIPVIVDDNYFVLDAFNGVTFKYSGKPFVASKNSYSDCAIEVPQNLRLDDSEEIFRACRVVRQQQVTWDSDAVGQALKYEKTGGSIRLPIPH